MERGLWPSKADETRFGMKSEKLVTGQRFCRFRVLLLLAACGHVCLGEFGTAPSDLRHRKPASDGFHFESNLPISDGPDLPIPSNRRLVVHVRVDVYPPFTSLMLIFFPFFLFSLTSSHQLARLAPLSTTSECTTFCREVTVSNLSQQKCHCSPRVCVQSSRLSNVIASSGLLCCSQA
ncbi:unnamed protein product [Protopolystoma xenopodis]|uniref:Transmembrane protein n=1 Tax=Protopolystoma xenopodis TaxID=117903 RepID=A0A3S5AB65_9PLAT|nr:unnamed protein product [Protopolystoma xenopodis]